MSLATRRGSRPHVVGEEASPQLLTSPLPRSAGRASGRRDRGEALFGHSLCYVLEDASCLRGPLDRRWFARDGRLRVLVVLVSFRRRGSGFDGPLPRASRRRRAIGLRLERRCDALRLREQARRRSGVRERGASVPRLRRAEADLRRPRRVLDAGRRGARLRDRVVHEPPRGELLSARPELGPIVERSVVERRVVDRCVVERSVVERSVVERNVVERNVVERIASRCGASAPVSDQ